MDSMDDPDEGEQQKSMFMVLPSQKESDLEEEIKILSSLPALNARPRKSDNGADSIPEHVKSLKSESTSDEEQRKTYKIIVPAADSEVDVVGETSCDEHKGPQKKPPGFSDPGKENYNAANPENKDEGKLSSTPSEYIGSLQFSGQPMIIPETVDDSGNDELASLETHGVPIIIPSSPTEVIVESDDSQDFDLHLSMSQSQCSDKHHRRSDTSISSEQDTVCKTVIEVNNSQADTIKVEPSAAAKDTEAPHFQIRGSFSQSSHEEKSVSPVENSQPLFRLDKPDFTADTCTEEGNAEESIFKKAKGNRVTQKRNIFEDDSEDLINIGNDKKRVEKHTSVQASQPDVSFGNFDDLNPREQVEVQRILHDSPSSTFKGTEEVSFGNFDDLNPREQVAVQRILHDSPSSSSKRTEEVSFGNFDDLNPREQVAVQRILHDSPSSSFKRTEQQKSLETSQREELKEQGSSGGFLPSNTEEVQYIAGEFSVNKDTSSQNSKFQRELDKVSSSPSKQTSSKKSFPESHVLAQSDPYKFHGSQSQIEERPQLSEPVDFSARGRGIIDTPTSSGKKTRYRKLKRAPRERQHAVKDMVIERKTDETKKDTEPVAHSSKEVQSLVSDPSYMSGSNITSTQGSGAMFDSNSLSRDTLSQDRRRSLDSNSSMKQSFQGTGLSYSTPTDSDECDRPFVRTLIKEYVEKITRRVITVEKHYQGRIIESKTVEEKDAPIILETRVSDTVKYLSPRPSPSRSVSTLTSGDLADISSFSTQISSLSSRGGSIHSLEKIPSISEEISPINQSADPINVGSGNGHNQSHGVLSRSDSDTAQFQRPLDRKRKRFDSASAKSKESSPEIVSSTAKIISDDRNPNRPSVASDSLFSSSPEQNGNVSHANVDKSHIVERMFEPDSSSDGHKVLASKESHQPVDIQDASTSRRNLSPDRTLNLRLSLSESDSSKKSKKVRFSDIGGESTNGNISEPRSPEIPYQHEKSVKESENESLVMAKWKDGYFYPGKIVGSTSCGKYRVEFVDGDKRVVKACDILVGDEFPIGQDVMVMGKENCFEMGCIVESINGSYIVEKIDGVRETHKHKDFILSPNQAAEIANNGFTFASDDASQIHDYANISLENLVEGVRSARKSKAVDSPKLPKTPDSKGKRKLEKMEGPKATSTPASDKKRKNKKPLSKSDEKKRLLSPDDKDTIKVPARKRLRVEEIEDSAFGAVIRSPSRSTRSSSNPATDTRAAEFIMPTKKTIFKGYTFLLTHVDKSQQQKEMEKKLLHDSSLDTSTDDSSMEESIDLPFDKDQIVQQIETGGGVVLHTFDDEKISSCKRCYLVAETYQRTVKYFQCLAAGIQCISHLWIQECCKANKLSECKSYLLPAGISIERKKLMEWNPRGDTLTGMRVLILSTNKQFVEAWTSVLTIAKCKIFTTLPSGRISGKLDFTVTDSTSSDSVIHQVKQNNIPVVSTEWVIQSLINGSVVSYEGHPRYSHSFVEKSKYTF